MRFCEIESSRQTPFRKTKKSGKTGDYIKTSIPGSARTGGVLINGKRIGINSGDEGIANLGIKVYKCIIKCNEESTK